MKNKLEISRLVNVYCFFITTKIAIQVVMISFTIGVAEEAVLALSGLFTELRRVSIKIEVTSRFELSNRLYQQGAVGQLFLWVREGVWEGSAQENFEISKPSKREFERSGD